MSFNPTFPDDADSQNSPEVIGGPSLIIGDGAPLEDDPGPGFGLPKPAPLEEKPTPAIITAASIDNNMKVLVSISRHTTFPMSFGIGSAFAQNFAPLLPIAVVQPSASQPGSRVTLAPKAPVFSDPSIKAVYLQSNADALPDANGPTVLVLELNNPLSPGGSYVVKIDSTTDLFGSPWESSFDLKAGGVAQERTVGGESLGKILPAILRSFGSAIEQTIGVPSTRIVEPVKFDTEQVRLETTAHFPESGQVFIGGRLFKYASKGSGFESYLIGIEALEPLGETIPLDTEVLLDVATILPD